MQTYLNQLRADIAAITADRRAAASVQADESFDDHIQEVERYLHQDPLLTLAQHTGLEKIRFPPVEKLTEAQCAELAVALAQCYFAFGVALDLPEQLPAPVRYRRYVTALDERVFTSYFGTTTIEVCHYDYDGYCPFAVPDCPCHRNWEEELAAIRLRPATQWDQHDRLELMWYDLRQEIIICNTRMLLREDIRPSVGNLVLRLQIAWERRHEWDVSAAYRPSEEDMPDGPGRRLFEWLEVENVVLPERALLSAAEIRIVAAYLLQLSGKELITLEVAAWPLERRYDALRKHFSCLLGRTPTPESMYLICLPGQEHIYNMAK